MHGVPVHRHTRQRLHGEHVMSQRISAVSKTISFIRTIESISVGLWLSLSISLCISLSAIAKTISMTIAKRRVAKMWCTIAKMMTSIAIQRVSISSSQSCCASLRIKSKNCSKIVWKLPGELSWSWSCCLLDDQVGMIRHHHTHLIYTFFSYHKQTDTPPDNALLSDLLIPCFTWWHFTAQAAFYYWVPGDRGIIVKIRLVRRDLETVAQLQHL